MHNKLMYGTAFIISKIINKLCATQSQHKIRTYYVWTGVDLARRKIFRIFMAADFLRFHFNTLL